MDSLGSLIKAARKERNWTQKDLAKESGFYPADISGWETGETAPRLSSVRKLAATLGKPIGYFLEENNASQEAVNEGEKKAKAGVDPTASKKVVSKDRLPDDAEEDVIRDQLIKSLQGQIDSLGGEKVLLKEKIFNLEKQVVHLEDELAEKKKDGTHHP